MCWHLQPREGDILGNDLKDINNICVTDGFDLGVREREGPWISALSNLLEDGTIYYIREDCQPGWG